MTKCPCENVSLCEPIRRRGPEKAYVMHGGFAAPHPGAPDDAYIWKRYDWSQITTIAVFGTLSDALYCHAHAHRARVTLGYKHAPWETNFTRIWQNATLVAAYARSHAAQTLNTHTDGWSLDMEAPVRDPRGPGRLGAVKRP
jgi:di-N-acetylchitobiase